MCVFVSVYPFQEGDEGSQYSKFRGIDKSFSSGKVQPAKTVGWKEMAIWQGHSCGPK